MIRRGSYLNNSSKCPPFCSGIFQTSSNCKKYIEFFLLLIVYMVCYNCKNLVLRSGATTHSGLFYFHVYFPTSHASICFLFWLFFSVLPSNTRTYTKKAKIGAIGNNFSLLGSLSSSFSVLTLLSSFLLTFLFPVVLVDLRKPYSKPSNGALEYDH